MGIRFAHHIPMVSNLKTMLHSLTNCVEAFMPALLLLCMVMYIFGLSFMQGCKTYLHKSKEGSVLPAAATVSDLELRFGSLAATFWTHWHGLRWCGLVGRVHTDSRARPFLRHQFDFIHNFRVAGSHEHSYRYFCQCRPSSLFPESRNRHRCNNFGAQSHR